jgi:hypothetical protein
VPTLSVSRAVVVLYGVSPTELQRAELTADAKSALKPLLQSRGFDLARPIRVDELPDLQGFRLMQDAGEGT